MAVVSVWRDRKHWEINLGPIRIERWCEGAPCDLRNYEGKHPIQARRRP